MNLRECELHSRGGSRFVDDLPLPEGTLHAAVFTSPVAHGAVESLDISGAETFPGVHAVLTASDIPGENQVGTIILDEPLLSSGEVHYIGAPMAVVLAHSRAAAKKAAGEIRVCIKNLPVVTDPRVAFGKGMLIAPPMTFCTGDVEARLADCDLVVEGSVESGGQEHLYLETQATLAVPRENGCLRLHSGTQGPTYVQRVTARVLGIPMNRIEVDVARLGGAFGGKEDQATPWAVMAALGAFVTGRAVKLVLDRGEDMRLTGKRHPYISDYRLGLSSTGKLQAWEVTYYQNGGAASDLSTAILERTLFHSTNAYSIPAVSATGICCRTNLAPNTAFRGFGGPQALFVLECALRRAADEMGVEPRELQARNLMRSEDTFYYGMPYGGDEIERSWSRLEELHDPCAVRDRIDRFNLAGGLLRKGMSVMPVCFGISFTNTSMNQANALVHIYTDGSVGVSTGAVEMGQGVNSKMATVASMTLGIDISRIRIETTNTTRAANTSPTAASCGADMNGNAVRIACTGILGRLLGVAADHLGLGSVDGLEVRGGRVLLSGEETGLAWDELISTAYFDRVSLSAHVHYSTPGIHFDRDSCKGSPFAYHAAGAALTEVTLDRLRGTFSVDSVRIVHDCGESIDPLIDLGQIEGGLLQGIGWVTMEDLRYDPATAALLSDSMAVYKVPDIHSTPAEVEVDLLECLAGNAGVFNSKAVGEPPFMYGIGTYFALLDALGPEDAKRRRKEPMVAPMTSERLLGILSSETDGDGD